MSGIPEDIKAQIRDAHTDRFYKDTDGVSWYRTVENIWATNDYSRTLSIAEMVVKQTNELTGKDYVHLPTEAKAAPVSAKREPVRKYAVNWEDSSYPRVEAYKAGWHAKPLSFQEAKNEIIDHFKDQIDFARIMIKQTRETRVKDILEEESSD